MTQNGDPGELGPAKTEIMEATYQALQKHGYDNLTIQDIADEFENSRTLLYYHYDGRDELLVDFLEYVLYEFLGSLPDEKQSARAELETLVEVLLPATLDEEVYRVQLAMFELRVNGPHDRDAREQYLRVDSELKDLLEDIFTRGLEAGEFADIEPAVEAELFLSLLTGTRTRRLTVYDPEESIHELRNAINTQIERISSS
ncbi:TetR family transcriptional regulator [Halorientalis sp. IM1011]|uniref:TetR/AcrR family transcriptional regulator n=1 Tax=Halorientalis sp. IM1011 TaxID=1932360 RepID=UPI00097CCEA4|nr:TetR/AcrR family transcriptional regulator [Halorientalis sp. IM1011]AQL41240.1 TetR family transcriptional regulator [Halorientalis sp. IM1011]